jgi:hypothetical protein
LRGAALNTSQLGITSILEMLSLTYIIFNILTMQHTPKRYGAWAAEQDMAGCRSLSKPHCAMCPSIRHRSRAPWRGTSGSPSALIGLVNQHCDIHCSLAYVMSKLRRYFLYHEGPGIRNWELARGNISCSTIACEPRLRKRGVDDTQFSQCQEMACSIAYAASARKPAT